MIDIDHGNSPDAHVASPPFDTRAEFTEVSRVPLPIELADWLIAEGLNDRPEASQSGLQDALSSERAQTGDESPHQLLPNWVKWMIPDTS